MLYRMYARVLVITTSASRDIVTAFPGNRNQSQIGQVGLISLLASYVVSLLVQILG
jgi:hypothetical protein